MTWKDRVKTLSTVGVNATNAVGRFFTGSLHRKAITAFCLGILLVCCFVALLCFLFYHNPVEKADADTFRPQQFESVLRASKEEEIQYLFSPAQLEDLNDDQVKEYIKFKKLPTTLDHGLFKCNKIKKNADITIAFKLKNSRHMNVIPRCVRDSFNNVIEVQTGGRLIENEDHIEGLIFFDESTYSVETLGGPYIAILKVKD